MSSFDEGMLDESWRNAAVADGFTLAATGDLLIDDVLLPRLQRESPELVELLQSSDVTVGNFESTAIDLAEFGGWPEAEAGGAWVISSPRVPQDLAAMGFNLLSRANNHTTDFGVQGMRSTDNLLDKAGIVHAGTGQTLAEARSPRFLHVPAGRVSMVAAASRFEVMSRAANPLGQIRGRPGVSALRTTRYVQVAPDQLAQLAAIRDSQPSGSIRPSIVATDETTGSVTLFGTTYVANPVAGSGIEFTFSMHDHDRTEILRNLRQGKQTSDFAVFGMHTHEPGNYSPEPPDFLTVLARQAIDNGADAFVGHGPHQLRGIEIYRQRPIFYSLGNFFFMINTQQPLTPDGYEKAFTSDCRRIAEDDRAESITEAEFLEHKRVYGVFKERIWYESVVAVCRYSNHGNLYDVRLHPIELHWSPARDADRGIPTLAPAESALRILNRLQELSKPFGTQIDIEDQVGVIHVQGAVSSREG
ncbi:poly-gamma-glutamate synthesis protein (capsule biosynthesis protein) [Kribbella sp. VKM Ac-2527]|uniref:Poly-gamma-glutamate synthesis protein (Capsule biosynthesis protein) n=1 Tax=Kribbella caucasensis TaxID=2512215 RepID=A0A4R6K8A5_9ACTN|nr:CapA family protein [Kribbella sp. VKM Ac-2527]TDO45769.1 poly-gamma-glutamate synthesis protein (capsule biosynthesis protein) [Kribbella sp. VKM Ac-2527]